MRGSTTMDKNDLDALLDRIATQIMARRSQIMLFADHTDLITALLNEVNSSVQELIVAGQAPPEIEMAADRAGLKVNQVGGTSPFVGQIDGLIEALAASDSPVYLANPNWVTGANFSLTDLQKVAEATRAGLLIIDEKYFDYFGITGAPLLEDFPHLVIIRSLTAGFSIASDDSGYLVAGKERIAALQDSFVDNRISSTLGRILMTTLTHGETAAKRLTQIHEEALRLTTLLTERGVQNRITATDFILLRVAEPRKVINYLARHGAVAQDLSLYADLQHYIRYWIQSPLSNEQFLRAFERMPLDYYKLKDIDKRAIMFHRPESGKSGDGSAPRVQSETTSRVTLRDKEPVA